MLVELELLLELELPPPQPTNQILVATSASDKTRLFVVNLFMNVSHSVIDVLSGDLLRDNRRNQPTRQRWFTEVRHGSPA